MRNAVLIFAILLLSSTVHAQDCEGYIEPLSANVVGNDLVVDVNFRNTGSVECELRVYLLRSNGDVVDKEPDLFWDDFGPGERGSYTVRGSVGEFADNIYKIELRDQHRGVVYARTGTVYPTTTIIPPTTTTIPTGACQGPPTDYLGRFECIVTILLCILVYLTPPVVLFMLLVGGIRFMSDAPLKRKEGKGVLMLAIGGAVMVMVLLALASLIAGIDVGMCWTAPGPSGGGGGGDCVANGGKCMTLECSSYDSCSSLYGSCSSGNCCIGDCTTRTTCVPPRVLEVEVLEA